MFEIKGFDSIFFQIRIDDGIGRESETNGKGVIRKKVKLLFIKYLFIM